MASSYVAIFCFYDVGAGGVLGLLLLLVSLVKEATGQIIDQDMNTNKPEKNSFCKFGPIFLKYI